MNCQGIRVLVITTPRVHVSMTGLSNSWNIRFPSSPLMIRVPFFLLFDFNKGTQKEKRVKGTTGAPRIQRMP